MKSPHAFLRAATLAALLASSIIWAAAAESSELAAARADLLEAYQRGQTDENNNVKQLRAKIAALEYIAAAQSTTTRESAPRLISVDFPGGPASALVAAISKSDRENSFNIIGEVADLQIALPAFSVRNADPAALATALNGILQPRGYILAASGRVSPAHAPVFTLRKMNPYESDQRQLAQLQSFQLAPYLEHQSVDDIIGAIRTAWELDPTRNPSTLRLKFHPPTGILLVSAPQEGIQMIHSVLKELRRTDPEQMQLRRPRPTAPPVPQKQ
jgi:hypothetical protein